MVALVFYIYIHRYENPFGFLPNNITHDYNGDLELGQLLLKCQVII